MSSKAVALTMGDSCYQASDKTTMSQRQVTWGSRLMYLLGLLVCFMFVWYVAKLQTEVTVMKSQLEENTRQIAKLHYLCQEHAAASDNSDDLDDEIVDESSEEDSNEEDELDIEVNLAFEPSLGESELQALGAFEIADRLAGDIAGNTDRRIKTRARRSVLEESTPSPGKTKSRSGRKKNKGGNRKDTSLGEDCCKRSCKHRKDCCGHCKEEKTAVASAHFVGDAATVASVNRDPTNPAMAKVGEMVVYFFFGNSQTEFHS
ncbi:uncharacterized protein LOC117103343 isoform X2 [Anneissia japonica]|uniref:uncharacterized protein LOC117103343 isoform X2 n=1 Tax=Anneissia japonica TaxID=1529436 RepID=UPI001425B12C|nr:uncharacterized protein LOC117103343 isoform X2 [Anneissia japonica]